MKPRLVLILAVFTCNLLVPVDAQTRRYARVISATANLRDTPSMAGGSEQEIEEGTIVKVLDEKIPWYVVRAGNHVGWMHGNTIEFIVRIQEERTSPARKTPSLQGLNDAGFTSFGAGEASREVSPLLANCSN